MAKFLDDNGLLYFWNKIKAKFIAEPATEGTNGQVLTTNGNGGRSWTSVGGTQVQADWSQSDTTAVDYIKNKPTIPTVNNATLTIQKNGTTVNSFTANASSDVTCNITVPTNNNELTNGSNFITLSALNRTNNVNVANTNYTTYMARGEALVSSATNPAANGEITWQYS